MNKTYLRAAVAVATVLCAACGGTTNTTGAAGTGGGGAGGGDGGASYSCGSDTCKTGQSFCYSFAGGTPGSGTSRSCVGLPAACTKNPTCACVCPPSAPPTIGCTYSGGFSSNCTCTESNREVTITCAGA